MLKLGATLRKKGVVPDLPELLVVPLFPQLKFTNSNTINVNANSLPLATSNYTGMHCFDKQTGKS